METHASRQIAMKGRENNSAEKMFQEFGLANNFLSNSLPTSSQKKSLQVHHILSLLSLSMLLLKPQNDEMKHSEGANAGVWGIRENTAQLVNMKMQVPFAATSTEA